MFREEVDDGREFRMEYVGPVPEDIYVGLGPQHTEILSRYLALLNVFQTQLLISFVRETAPRDSDLERINSWVPEMFIGGEMIPELKSVLAGKGHIIVSLKLRNIFK